MQPSAEDHGARARAGDALGQAAERPRPRGRPEPLGPALELYTMRADGGDVRRITRNRVPDLRPNWQPLR